jgi:hypothetical protein
VQQRLVLELLANRSDDGTEAWLATQEKKINEANYK